MAFCEHRARPWESGGHLQNRPFREEATWLVPNAEQRPAEWMQQSAGLSTTASGTFHSHASNDTVILCFVHFQILSPGLFCYVIIAWSQILW